MFPYKDIPHEIKESVDINSLRRIAPKWDNQKILSKYLESYSMGMGMITEHRQKDPDYIPTRIQYLLSVLVIKKETFIMTTVTIKVSLSHLIRMLIEKSIASADGFKPADPCRPAFRYSLLYI